jgi:ankyrin repeat protein/uncharacterized membrane protein
MRTSGLAACLLFMVTSLFAMSYYSDDFIRQEIAIRGKVLPKDLVRAAEYNDTILIKNILEFKKSISVNAVDSISGKTALMAACEKGAPDAVTMLLRKGADINAKTDSLNPYREQGYTALIFAAESGHAGIVQSLIAAGADVNKKDALGRTALHHAAASDRQRYYSEEQAPLVDHQAVMKLLINSNADINAVDLLGNTPLLLCTQNGNNKVLKFLIEMKADLNKQDAYRKTALIYAVEDGDAEAVRALLSAGADPNIPNKVGWTPWMIAQRLKKSNRHAARLSYGEGYGRKKNPEEVLRLLEMHGAKKAGIRYFMKNIKRTVNGTLYFMLKYPANAIKLGLFATIIAASLGLIILSCFGQKRIGVLKSAVLIILLAAPSFLIGIKVGKVQREIEAYYSVHFKQGVQEHFTEKSIFTTTPFAVGTIAASVLALFAVLLFSRRDCSKETSFQYQQVQSLRFAFQTVCNNIGFFFGVQIIPYLIIAAVLFSAVFIGVRLHLRPMFMVVIPLLQIGATAFLLLIQMGLIKSGIMLFKQGKCSVSDFLSVRRLFFRYLLTWILYSLIVTVGLLFVVIPGAYLAVRFFFFSYFIIDGTTANPIEALKKSYSLTKGMEWQIFLFGLLMMGIACLGAIALIIGLLFAIPVAVAAASALYCKLTGQASVISQASP